VDDVVGSGGAEACQSELPQRRHSILRLKEAEIIGVVVESRREHRRG